MEESLQAAHISELEVVLVKNPRHGFCVVPPVHRERLTGVGWSEHLESWTSRWPPICEGREELVAEEQRGSRDFEDQTIDARM